MTVRIITDSTCDLPEEYVSENGIRVLPLYIQAGDEQYLDGIDITREEFYRKLPTFSQHPTTAVPSPLKFHTMYDALAEEGASEIISIHISSSLSAISNVARIAAAETTSVPVTVLDSRSLSMGTGFLVQTAAELAKTGRTVKEILKTLESQIKRTHVWAALDTLTYLRRSGRMNPFLSTIGELIQIKPILKMNDGISGVERVRTHKHAFTRLLHMLHTLSPFEKLAFLHSNALDQAEALKNEVRDLYAGLETWIGIVNPVLGSHLGPGVVGFACVKK
ncbi:MAG: DegV family protein [Anaerolineaceae bacterium]|nr:DegV family protein [Anaerolineaceae bacterium]MBN2677859.1 DegV family protein [Anaerolineaceae bacterium]